MSDFIQLSLEGSEKLVCVNVANIVSVYSSPNGSVVHTKTETLLVSDKYQDITGFLNVTNKVFDKKTDLKGTINVTNSQNGEVVAINLEDIVDIQGVPEGTVIETTSNTFLIHTPYASIQRYIALVDMSNTTHQFTRTGLLLD